MLLHVYLTRCTHHREDVGKEFNVFKQPGIQYARIKALLVQLYRAERPFKVLNPLSSKLWNSSPTQKTVKHNRSVSQSLGVHEVKEHRPDDGAPVPQKAPPPLP